MGASRRAALLGLGALLAPSTLRAQAAWPSQPIKMVVPYPPGALTDVLGRLVGERITAAFGQPARTYRYGPFTIMVWNKNLLAELHGPPAAGPGDIGIQP